MQITRIDKVFQIVRICEMAKEIWNEHYTPLIGKDQVDYMLEHFQSPTAVKRQLQDGYAYYIFSQEDGEDFGYMAIQKQADVLFLSKLYILKDYRGNGAAKQAIEFLKQLCVKDRLDCIRLTVNKGNAGSIAAYRKLGLQTVDAVVTDIGGGYVMDDYIMEIRL